MYKIDSRGGGLGRSGGWVQKSFSRKLPVKIYIYYIFATVYIVNKFSALAAVINIIVMKRKN